VAAERVEQRRAKQAHGRIGLRGERGEAELLDLRLAGRARAVAGGDAVHRAQARAAPREPRVEIGVVDDADPGVVGHPSLQPVPARLGRAGAHDDAASALEVPEQHAAATGAGEVDRVDVDGHRVQRVDRPGRQAGPPLFHGRGAVRREGGAERRGFDRRVHRMLSKTWSIGQ
jgi:hypothetical protein